MTKVNKKFFTILDFFFLVTKPKILGKFLTVRLTEPNWAQMTHIDVKFKMLNCYSYVQISYFVFYILLAIGTCFALTTRFARLWLSLITSASRSVLRAARARFALRTHSFSVI